jgi:hypothetical protein
MERSCAVARGEDTNRSKTDPFINMTITALGEAGIIPALQIFLHLN